MRTQGWAVAAMLVLAQAAPVHAQYFGRNQVQWERLRFEVLQTEHFDIHYYAEEKAAAEQVGRMAERWYARLSTTLAFQLKERQPVILYASQGHFQQTKTVGGQPGEGTGGVTEAYKRRIVMPVGASLAETDHVLGHELVHAFQFAMTGHGRLSSNNAPAALTMPLWFIEGMAEYLSVGPNDAHTAMWIRDATRKEAIPTLAQLENRKYFPYRYGQAAWAYLAGRFGDEVMGKALRALRPQSNDAGEILQAVVGVDEKTLSKDWHAAIRAGAEPQLVGRKSAAAFADPLVTEEGDGGDVNVGPALSPDGSRLAFLSERDQFSIELFVADGKTGKVTRRLSRQAVDPHVESLQFINSAGAWNREGTRVALGAVSKGRPLLVILDARTGDKRARGAAAHPGRGADPELLAGRQARGVRRPGRRVHRPVRLRSRGLRPAAPHQRCVRRPAAVLVARRPPDRLHHRPFLDRPPPAPSGQLPAGPARRRFGRDPRAARVLRGQEHQPAVEPDRRLRLLPLRRRGGHQRLPGRGRGRRALPADRPPDRRQRDHRAQPRAERCLAREPPCLFRVRGREIRDLFHRRLRAAGRMGGGEQRTP